VSEHPHGVDDRAPEPPRTPGEIIRELALALPHMVAFIVRLLRDRRVSRRRKLVAAAAAAYVVSPIDLVPDLIPAVGHVDDVVAVAFALDHLLSGVPREVHEELWGGSEDVLDLLTAFSGWGAELVPVKIRRLAGR
jgi:uncharacterized membrane protein YkvA (DUF1232 family)